MVSAFYFVNFILAVCLTGINLFRHKKADARFVLIGIIITLHCYGVYMTSVADTLKVAILANKIVYIGACFVGPVVISIIVQFCGMKMNNFVKLIMYGMAVVVYAFAFTAGKSDIYYKTIELKQKDDYYYLVKEYGPVHDLYVVFLALCFAIFAYYITLALIRRKNISFRVVFSLCFFGLAIIACYFITRMLDSTVEWLTIGYLLVNVLLIYLFDRFNMYDMSINISNYVERMQEFGYIVFDKKYRYMSSNEFARSLFPEINGWYVDRVAPEDDSLVYKEVVKDLDSWYKSGEERKLIVGDKCVELDVRDLRYGRRNKVVGCIIEITDKTLEEKYLQTLESYNDDLEQEVKEKTEDILYIKDMMVLGMATMVESRDNSTGGHIKRTSDVVKVFSKHLLNGENSYGFTKEFLGMLKKVAPMHDLGKIAVDDKILRKDGKFTDEEYSEMKKHSAEGAKIVERILTGVEEEDFVRIAVNVAHYHHEKWNGKGYPCGLAGEDIPVEARIMALADVFDALVSKRCYKEAFSYDKAFSIIKEDLGSHFDPVLGRAFLECREDLEKLYDGYNG